MDNVTSDPMNLPQIIDFLEHRCIGIDQSADAMRWKIIHGARAIIDDTSKKYAVLTTKYFQSHSGVGLMEGLAVEAFATWLDNIPVEVTEPSICLNGYELQNALRFLAPDNEPEQLACEVHIQWVNAGHSGTGFYASEAEYPEEGSILLKNEAEASSNESSEQSLCRLCSSDLSRHKLRLFKGTPIVTCPVIPSSGNNTNG